MQALTSAVGVFRAPGWLPGGAVGVYEAGSITGAGGWFAGDHLFGERFADHAEPLLPLLGGVRFAVGMQEVVPTDRTTSVLHAEQVHGAVAQGRGLFPAAPVGPIPGQGGVVRGRRALDPIP